jgi:UDP-glucose 4-epimerase
MKLLITGGAGFIGSNLCDLLVKKDCDIVVVDDLSTGHQSNLSSIINKIEFYEEKIEYFDFDKVFGIDAVVHLAAQPSVPLSVANFCNSSSSNMLGSINTIDFCKSKHIPLIYASSSAIYGNLLLGDDESNKIDLLSPYAADKYAMELYAKVANKLYQLSSVGLRFFNVYGPRQDPNSPYSGVISIFADRVLEGREIVINGGHQTRDFVYVKDVVDTIFKAVIIANKKEVCEVSNVLTGKSIPINHIANQVMDVVGKKINKIYKELPFGDPEQSDGTVKKMVKLFSIQLEKFTTLEKGLKETVEYIESYK